MAQQGIPIIIRGRSSKGIMATAIQIQADSAFQITQQFQSQPNEWVQSDSDFSISYIESVMIGQMGENLQFCQTSSMAHPLTYEFKDDKDTNIFTIAEVTSKNGYSLQISVDLPDDYFQITQSSAANSNEWSNSVFDTADIDIYAVEVTDANGVPVCRLLRASGEDIFLNLEPSA